MDLIAEFCLIFILLKKSANFVYYTSYVVCYKNCHCFFYQKKKSGKKKFLNWEENTAEDSSTAAHSQQPEIIQ